MIRINNTSSREEHPMTPKDLATSYKGYHITKMKEILQHTPLVQNIFKTLLGFQEKSQPYSLVQELKTDGIISYLHKERVSLKLAEDAMRNYFKETLTEPQHSALEKLVEICKQNKQVKHYFDEGKDSYLLLTHKPSDEMFAQLLEAVQKDRGIQQAVADFAASFDEISSLQTWKSAPYQEYH